MLNKDPGKAIRDIAKVKPLLRNLLRDSRIVLLPLLNITLDSNDKKILN